MYRHGGRGRFVARALARVRSRARQARVESFESSVAAAKELDLVRIFLPRRTCSMPFARLVERTVLRARGAFVTDASAASGRSEVDEFGAGAIYR